jgi:hypothetical protein
MIGRHPQGFLFWPRFRGAFVTARAGRYGIRQSSIRLPSDDRSRLKAPLLKHRTAHTGSSATRPTSIEDLMALVLTCNLVRLIKFKL